MILRIPAYNPLGVCPKCWAAGTPHNGGGLGRGPYLRVPYCQHNDVSGDRIQCPVLEDDRFVVDGKVMIVKAARIESDSLPENAPSGGQAWVWIIEAAYVVETVAFDPPGVA